MDAWSTRLQDLGPEHCTTIFAECDVDRGVLGPLTNADPAKFGESLGYRKKLPKASELNGREAPAPAAQLFQLSPLTRDPIGGNPSCYFDARCGRCVGRISAILLR